MMRRRGFTFIEMIVVIFMLMLFTAMVYPSVTAVLRSQAASNYRTELITLTQKAREQALRTRRATVVKFDNAGRLGWDFAQDEITDVQGNPLRSTGAEEQQLELGALRDPIDAPVGTDFHSYRVGRADVSQADFAARFYPDGTADRAYMELSQNGRIFLLAIDPTNGNAELREETLNEQTEDEWDAGELEQRVG